MKGLNVVIFVNPYVVVDWLLKSLGHIDGVDS